MEFLVGRNNSDFSFIFHNCHSYYIKKWTRAFKCFIVFFNGRVMCYFVMLLVVYCECWLCGLASMNTDTHENTDTHDCVQLNKWTDPHPMLWLDYTVGGIAHICFKQWFQITADAHPGVSGVSKDQKFCEKFKNTHCQVDHPAKIE